MRARSTAAFAAVILTTGCVRLMTVTPAFMPTTAPPPPPASDSRVTLPIEIDGVDLGVVDTAVPPLFGDTQYENIPVLGTEQVNYMMWRDPITPRLTDATVSMQLHPYFFISVGDAYDPIAQCGFRHETAQERLLGITSTLAWNPKWSLQSTTTWMFLPITPAPQPPMLKCTLGTGPWEYDAEAKLNGILTDKINGLASDLDTKIKSATDVQQSAADLWKALRATIDVAPDMHIQLRPYAIAAGPITSATTAAPGVYDVNATVEISGRPRLVVGPPPDADTTPLPDVTGTLSGNKGFVLNFEAEMPFTEANRIIATKFPIVERYGNHELVLCNPVLRPSGTRVILELELFSLVAAHDPPHGFWSRIASVFTAVRDAFEDLLWTSSAKIYLVGTPQFDAARRDVVFGDLDFTIETRNVLVKTLDWLLHGLVLEDVKALARLNFGDQIDRVYPALNDAMNRRLGAARLTGYTNEVRPDAIFVTDQSILARAHAAGDLSMVIGLTKRAPYFKASD